MLLLHTDVFLAAGGIVLGRPLAVLRAGPGPPHIAAAVLLHRDPLFYQVAVTSRRGWDGVGGGGGGLVEWGEGGGEGGRREGKGGGGVCRGRSTNLGLSASPASVRTSR